MSFAKYLGNPTGLLGTSFSGPAVEAYPVMPFHARTAIFLVAAIALLADPSFAQRRERRDGDEGGRHPGVERAQPRGRVESQPPRPERPRGNDDRGRDNRRFGNGSDGGHRRERVQPYRGEDRRGHDGPRDDPRRFSNRPDNRSFSNRSDGDRFPRAVERDRSYGYRRYENRSYNDRPFGYRSYGHQSYSYRPGRRSYVLPFGYRSHGYRPGWSLNLYFGRAYAAYGYPGYGYPSAGYGYYSLIPGRLYGAVRIIDAPRDAQVFVDGYYAGVVDDYDGVFQHLNLEAGPHHIEIEVDGYPPIGFDVQVVPGQTITCRANIF
jgi:hypothetical protein